jgi:16S rRNA (cytosine967-C5)-methyltransferase
MTPSARVQAAIELLDAIITATREAGPAADTIIQRWFKQRRYAGSKDRRAIRELVYRAIRRFGDPPESGRAAMLGVAADDPALTELFDGSGYGPSLPVAGEAVAARGLLPGWIGAHLDPLAGPAESLLERAPLDLRVNRLKASREAILEHIPQAAPTPHAPLGLRLPEGFPIGQHDAWRSGQVEVQDEGSQLVSLACSARPGSLVVDLCAGAGGKTLALAAEMDNSGRILACDVNRERLSRLPPRLERAGVSIVEMKLLDAGRESEALASLAGTADTVLVDAPCSGSGTWRRNPETRWRLTPKRLEQLVHTQAYLLDIAVGLLRPGGQLVYAVCSLLTDEGRAQAQSFAARHPSLVQAEPGVAVGAPCGPGRMLVPARDGTDGFFVACWQAPC